MAALQHQGLLSIMFLAGHHHLHGMQRAVACNQCCFLPPDLPLSVKVASRCSCCAGYCEEEDWIDLATVKGYRRIVMCQEVRDELDANLTKHDSGQEEEQDDAQEEEWQRILIAMCDGRLLPTPWLNKVAAFSDASCLQHPHLSIIRRDALKTHNCMVQNQQKQFASFLSLRHQLMQTILLYGKALSIAAFFQQIVVRFCGSSLPNQQVGVYLNNMLAIPGVRHALLAYSVEQL